MTVILSVVATVDSTVTGATEVSSGGICIGDGVRGVVIRNVVADDAEDKNEDGSGDNVNDGVGVTKILTTCVEALVLTIVDWLVITMVDGRGVLVAACVLAEDPEVPAAVGPSAR